MIEVARALVKSKCQLKYSIIFVAFDKEEVAIMMIVIVVMMILALNLMTFSFVMVQVGSQGSHEFIRGFLVPTIFKESGWPEFQVGLWLSSKWSMSSSWPLASM